MVGWLKFWKLKTVKTNYECVPVFAENAAC